jgi:hypothetical protein
MPLKLNDNVFDKLSQRLAAKGLSTRGDIKITDVLPIDRIKCKVAVTYDSSCSTPTIAQVEEWVQDTFNGKVRVQTSTLQSHKANNACSFLATINAESRSLADSKDMQRLAGNAYMDTNTGSVWSVVDDGNVKYLVRQAEENISDIITTRIMRTSKNDAKFASLKTAAPIVQTGDQVKYMSTDNIIQFGEISHISGDKVSISANGGSDKIDIHSIIEVTDRSSSNLQSEKGILEDYFAKAYGDPAFAKELTKEISSEKGLGEKIPDSKNKSHK